MGALVSYSIAGAVAVVAMDDDKRNVLSLQMFAELSAALDRAEAARAPVVLAGRAGTFSAGFDLRALMAGGPDAYRMVRTGFELAERMLAFPTPIVAACTGNARAMGAFLLLSADYRLGTTDAYTVQANEVAIGITMPFFGVEICRQRLTPAAFQRAVINAEAFAPADAVHAGFLDRLVPAAELLDVAHATAVALGQLPAQAHAATKLRARAETLKAVRAAIDADDAAFRGAA